MTTVSPGSTRSAGGCWPMVLKNLSESKRSVVKRFPPGKVQSEQAGIVALDAAETCTLYYAFIAI